MKTHILFLSFGFVLGVAIFLLPSAFSVASGFAVPVLFLAGPWFLDALPYLVVFIMIFAAIMAVYRITKRPFPVSLVDGAWVLFGIYIALTLLFYFTVAVMRGGTLVL